MERIIRFNPGEWGKYKSQLMQLERESYSGELLATESVKREMVTRKDFITLLYEKDGNVIGECYGTRLDNYPFEEHIPAELPAGKKRIFYMYSLAVLPKYRKNGIAPRLTKASVAHAKAKGFTHMMGHAQEGRAVKITIELGARIIGKFDDWFGTGKTHYLYDIDISKTALLRPVRQTAQHMSGPACIKSIVEYLKGVSIPQKRIARYASTSEYGTSADCICRTLEGICLSANVARNAPIDEIRENMKKGYVYVANNAPGMPEWSLVESVGHGYISMINPSDATYSFLDHGDMAFVDAVVIG